MEDNNTGNNIAKSSGCGRCGLCGKFGTLENMVANTNVITTLHGKTINLKQHLTCRDYGIYSAQCIVCKDIYIGQTCTSFSKRWNLHRQDWKTMINSGKNYREKTTADSDDKALYYHYVQHHKTMIAKTLNLWDAYQLTFAERPNKSALDTAESCWMEVVDAGINKAKTCLPKFK